uniref:Delta-aminolevulinic acid dehydratase n=1 Tax=Ascaris lumbricoides TaxID=6252 RepID=A0A0M3HKI4_ASCLU
MASATPRSFKKNFHGGGLTTSYYLEYCRATVVDTMDYIVR